MRKHLLLALALLVAVTLAVGASAQLGTPNFPSALTNQGDPLWQVEGRFYPGGNVTLSLGGTARVGERSDVSLRYTRFNGDSDSPLAGAMRDSRWSGLAVTFRQTVTRPEDRWQVAVIPSFEFGLSRPRGTHRPSGAFADENRVTPALDVPIQFPLGKGTFIMNHDLVFFEKNIDDSTGGTTRGFGTVFVPGYGYRYPIGERSHLVADVARPFFFGNNSLDKNTNLPDRRFVWSAGWQGVFGDEGQTHATVFVTNAAGPSLATSVIATPGNGVGLGVQVGHVF